MSLSSGISCSTFTLKIFDSFYAKFSEHIAKRHKFSHEGLLSYRSLDNFYMTDVLTALSCPRDKKYIRGTQENTILLQETKENFLDELNQYLEAAEQVVLDLGELCLDKLMPQIDYEFMQKHCTHLKDGNNKYLNDYLVQIGL